MKNDDDFEKMISESLDADINDMSETESDDTYNAKNSYSGNRGIVQQTKDATKSAVIDVAKGAKEEIINSIKNGDEDIPGLAKRGLVAGLTSWLSRSTTGRAVKRIFSGESTLDDFFDVTDSINPLFKVAHEMLNNLRHGSCEQLRYEDMIKGIKQNCPKNEPTVAGCCVLQEKADLNTKVIFIYIDDNDEPIFGNGPKPYGFYLFTKSFDDELIEAFGGEDMLVVR